MEKNKETGTYTNYEGFLKAFLNNNIMLAFVYVVFVRLTQTSFEMNKYFYLFDGPHCQTVLI